MQNAGKHKQIDRNAQMLMYFQEARNLNLNSSHINTHTNAKIECVKLGRKIVTKSAKMTAQRILVYEKSSRSVGGRSGRL